MKKEELEKFCTHRTRWKHNAQFETLSNLRKWIGKQGIRAIALRQVFLRSRDYRRAMISCVPKRYSTYEKISFLIWNKELKIAMLFFHTCCLNQFGLEAVVIYVWSINNLILNNNEPNEKSWGSLKKNIIKPRLTGWNFKSSVLSPQIKIKCF